MGPNGLYTRLTLASLRSWRLQERPRPVTLLAVPGPPNVFESIYSGKFGACFCIKLQAERYTGNEGFGALSIVGEM